MSGAQSNIVRIVTAVETWVLFEAGLAIFAAIYAYSYNFPLFLFGLYAIHNHENVKPLQVFTSFLVLSMIVDIVAMALLSYNLPYQSGIAKFALSMTIIGIIFKPVVILLSVSEMQKRGVHLPVNFPTSFGGSGTTGGSTYNPLDQDHNAASASYQQYQPTQPVHQPGYPPSSYPPTTYTVEKGPATVPATDDSEINSYQSM